METIDRLTLEDDDDEVEVEIEATPERELEINPALCLVGRFLTNRPIRLQWMKVAMGGVWSPVRGVTIKQAETGIFVFQFHHHLDLKKVLKGGPWFYNKHMLILGSMAEANVPSQVPLYTVPFWVQVHNIPVGSMSEKNGKQIAASLGEFLEYDEKNNSNFWRKYMRIRVMLDVRKPLRQTRRLKKQDGESHEVQLKYERLGMFCYYCGLMGHTDDSCDLLFSVEEDDGVRKWGPTMRAEAKRGVADDGGRWLREEGQSWKTPNQEERGEPSKSLKKHSLEGLNEETKRLEERKDLMAELMRNPSKLFPKNHNLQFKNIMKEGEANNDGGALGKGMKEGNNDDTDEEIIVEDKKRKLFNENLSCLVSKMVEGERMMVDSVGHVDASNATWASTSTREENSTETEKNMNFLSAGPGKQACREK
jgi:hypothetical protein